MSFTLSSLTASLTASPLNLARRILQLLVGLFLYGFAIALMIRGGIGVPPWDVLTQGIALQTGWAFGLLTNLIGAIVLLLWIPIRQKPGVGTVLNVLLIGPSIEVGLLLVPAQDALPLQILLFAGGLALLAVASGLYLGARMGPGPRDGLMTGINRRWGWRIWIVRTAIEASVLSIGWLLGGNVGLGTLAFALLIGPMVGFTMPLLRVPEVRRAGRGGRESGAGADAAGGAAGAGAAGAGAYVAGPAGTPSRPDTRPIPLTMHP